VLSVYHFRSAISSLVTQVLPFVHKAIQRFPECKKEDAAKASSSQLHKTLPAPQRAFNRR